MSAPAGVSKPPLRLEVDSGKSIIVTSPVTSDDASFRKQPAWSHDGQAVGPASQQQVSRVRSVGLAQGENRSCLVIDSTNPTDSGRYDPAGINILVRKPSATDPSLSKDAKLVAEVKAVHYPHPMAPVFIRELPDKVIATAGDSLEISCRLWGMPNTVVTWMTAQKSS